MSRLELSRDDPVYFNEHILRRTPYWSAQAEWARAVVDYRVVAIETGNSLGKGFLIGGLVPWFLWTRKNSLVYVCGAGQTQIGSVLWKEIRRAVQGCPFWKAGLLPLTISPGIKSSPATATVKPGWGAIGFSTSTIERASGHHAKHMLVIVDEASGVEDEAWQAIDSLGFSKLVVSGNPIRAEGRFAELCDLGDRDALEHRPARLSCKHFNVPSTASPHAHLDRSPWGMADKTWLDAVAREPGKSSPWYKSHVLAQRPKLSTERVLQPEWIQVALSEEVGDAVRALRGPRPHGRIRLGCDVGEGVGRSRTVIIVRDDLGILEIYASEYVSKSQSAEEICIFANKYRVPIEGIAFDGSGNTGRDLTKALESRYGAGLRPFFGGSSGPFRWYTNLRSACAGALARRLEPVQASNWKPFRIPPTADVEPMLRELNELRWRLKGQKSELEPKEDMMLRMGRSPDYADALLMTFRTEATDGV